MYSPINSVKITGQSHSCLSHTLRRLTRIHSQPLMTHTRSSKWSPPMASPVTKKPFPTLIAKSLVMGPLASSSRPDSLASLTSPSSRQEGPPGQAVQGPFGLALFHQRVIHLSFLLHCSLDVSNFQMMLRTVNCKS